MSLAIAPAALDDLLTFLNADERRELEAHVAAPLPSLPHTAYQRKPLDWITQKLGVPKHTISWADAPGFPSNREWDGTPQPMVEVLNALAAWRNVGVESGTTTGKTYLGACIVLWFLACFEDSIVVTVAPKKEQLEKHIWKEIGRLWPRFQLLFPEAEKSSLRIRMRTNSDVWGASGFVAGVRAEEVEGSATKAQGFHAEHMLIVFEETPGIAPAIMTAFKNTCRAPHNLRAAFGNPDHQHDELHRFCVSPRTVHVRVSAYDHPNVVCDDPSIVPGAVSRQGIEEALEDAKEDGGAESRMFQSRVRGVSPAESADALIKLEWCERSVDRPMTGYRLAFGVDVANSESGDKAAIAKGTGSRLDSLRAFACNDANVLGHQVWDEAMREGVELLHVGIDSVGVGAGTVNTLREHRGTDRFGKEHDGSNARALNGSAKPVTKSQKAPDGSLYDWIDDANEFFNLRAQMWWQMREDLRLGRVTLVNDRALFHELTTPTWERKNGKVRVEEKTEIKKRLGRSPDRADAVVYWNWVRPRASEEFPKSAIPRSDVDKMFEHAMGEGQDHFPQLGGSGW